jgi:uncharacterized OB-fold protein
MEDLKSTSPLGVYQSHCARGELAYQVDGNGVAVFHPRIVAPGTGQSLDNWKISKGLGTVYATTVVANRDAPDHNVVLVDLDEGFRMMSRVEEIDPMLVRIGMRVKLLMLPPDGEKPALPVFVPTRQDP